MEIVWGLELLHKYISTSIKSAVVNGTLEVETQFLDSVCHHLYETTFFIAAYEMVTQVKPTFIINLFCFVFVAN